MRVAYFDCFSGISGDMALGALIAAGAGEDALLSGLQRLQLPGWKLEVRSVERNGIGATDVQVMVDAEHSAAEHHRHLPDIVRLIERSGLPAAVKRNAVSVFQKLAQAEATVHRKQPDEIHFHEIGAVDAIVDIVGACLALDLLGIERIECSPLPMGHGFVSCAHGEIPLPAPAVVELCRNVPVYGVDFEGELVTPTGAALVATLAGHFGPPPSMQINTSGYGAGKRSFGERPNLLRMMIGEAVSSELTASIEVVVMECNLDDFSPELYDLLMERLLQAGALDVSFSPIQMKKNRPATLVQVISDPLMVDKLADILFTETSTLGIRYQTMRRFCLERKIAQVHTEYGEIRVKIASWRGKPVTVSPEYEDVKASALRNQVPGKRVYEAVQQAYKRLHSSE